MNTFMNELKGRCIVTSNDAETGMRSVYIAEENSCCFRAKLHERFTDNVKGVSYDVHNEVKRMLDGLQTVGLIKRLNFAQTRDRGAEVSFKFVDGPTTLIRSIFDKIGTVLELHLWQVCMNQEAFHDVHPNFGFYWSSAESVSNEIDLVLTQGLRTCIVSCKSSAIRLDHVYEVIFLAQRFSSFSKPAIVYASNRCWSEKYPKGIGKNDENIPVSPALRERIKAMGVELIILDEVGSELGDTLKNLFD